jgi:hypothetical protein
MRALSTESHESDLGRFELGVTTANSSWNGRIGQGAEASKPTATLLAACGLLDDELVALLFEFSPDCFDS